MFEQRRLPQPDEMGFFFHPDIPGKDESDNVRELCKALGFDVAVVDMEGDNEQLADAWHEDEDLTAATRWTPTPPNGEGWALIAKFDTEDGPHAMFVRPILNLSESQTEPSTREEIEAFLEPKIKAGEADTGLYDVGLSYVVVDVVGGKVTFEWFSHAMPFNDLLND
jgi:hypothetical protein